jgi:Tol biopolymer transport system component
MQQSSARPPSDPLGAARPPGAAAAAEGRSNGRPSLLFARLAIRLAATALALAAFAPGVALGRGQQEGGAQGDDEAEASRDDGAWDVADTPGASTEVDVDVTEGTWMGVDVAPDGREIVFDLLGDLYLLPIAGGEAQALTEGPVWDMQPRFSPDGREIAFTSDRAGGDNIWVIAREGGEPRQISDESFRLANSPAWTPDGEWIAARKHFSSRRSLGSGEIWLWHASGTGSGLQLNEKPNEQKDLGEPAFSPDGRWVYLSQDTTPGGVFEYSKDSNTGIYSIRRLDRETGEIETVISGPGGAVRPTPSPDGTRLAFVRRVRFVSTLFVHDLRSGENTPVLRAPRAGPAGDLGHPRRLPADRQPPPRARTLLVRGAVAGARAAGHRALRSDLDESRCRQSCVD